MPGTSLPPLPDNVDSIGEVVEKTVKFCIHEELHNPVEILKQVQKHVTGRSLEIAVESESIDDGETNFILVDRSHLLMTAFEELEMKETQELRNTLGVQFYNETALDYGGPRKEFFRLILCEIKEKYFDNGLSELLAEEYKTVGIVFALSILQNGKLPCFMTESVREELWNSDSPCRCVQFLRQGLNMLGIYEIVKQLPSLQFLFHQPSVPLTVKKLTTLLKPTFSAEGSNIRMADNVVYRKFIKYLREVASGRREGLDLQCILQFLTGADEEPVLGFKIHLSITFAESSSFLPTSNTCINTLNFPRPSAEETLHEEGKLFDYAFANAFYGLK